METLNDIPDPPKSLELTDFDKAKIESLDIGETWITENKLFKIVRHKDGFNISHGKTLVKMPGLYSVFGYLTH